MKTRPIKTTASAKKRIVNAAFTRTELLTILAIICLLAALLLPILVRSRAFGKQLQCVNLQKQLGIGFRLFAADHQDKYPNAYFTNKTARPFNISGTNFVAPHFLSMSNEIVNPRILVCPSDRRMPATSWTNLSDTNISYFVGLDADETRPAMLLAGDRNLTVDGKPVPSGIVTFNATNQVGFSTSMHNGVGNAALADGSVQSLTSSRLAEQLRSASNAVQRLAIPR